MPAARYCPNCREQVMRFPHRRQFLHLAASAAGLPAVSRVATAQTYPTRPVTMIVPFAAGGPTDVAARVVSENMSRTLGQQFVVENVVGAGGTVGSLRTMRANPDGYTIQMGHMGKRQTSSRSNHETSPPKVLASGSGCCRPPGLFRDRESAGLSDAAGTDYRRLGARRPLPTSSHA
jgi:Tripartite tricarboxylate transporter family receptor